MVRQNFLANLKRVNVGAKTNNMGGNEYPYRSLFEMNNLEVHVKK